MKQPIKINKNLKFAAILTSGFVLIFLVYIGYRLNSSGRSLIPVTVIALLAGVIFEARRLADKWSTVLWTSLASLVISFVAFIPGKRETNYNFESHLEFWPYAFILIFALISISFHGDKVIAKLTEGITLFQSITVIYWVLDHGFAQTNHLVLKVLMGIGLILSLYTLFHAFSYARLSRTSRLTLSIWSSLVMILLATDHIYRVYQNEQIENVADITHGLYIALQFFLLGVSVIYIVQNFLMVMGFLPGKRTFFNQQYFKDLKELKKNHVDRYSDKQVNIFHSFFCVLFTTTMYGLNYYYQIFPSNIVIWMAFVIFPFLIFIYSVIGTKQSTNNSTDNIKIVN